MPDEIDILFEYMLDELRDILRDHTERGEMLAEVNAEPEAQQIKAQIEALRGFQAKVIALRKEWSHIDLTPIQPQQETLPEVNPSPAIPRGLRTPNQAFHLPILVALVQLGGRAGVQTVLDRVHRMLKDQLNEYDYQSLPSNPHAIRWENNAQWARYQLVQQGYLHADSPRGVWEITAAGRARVGEAGAEMGAAEESGEYHTQPLPLKEHMRKISFEIGKTYNRQTDLHDKFGGNRQSGIAACAEHPLVLLFTAPAGDEFGYQDGWRSEEEYIYTGEGQVGDMEMTRGNRAILDHQGDGRALHLFQKASSGTYVYLGELVYQSHQIVRGEDAEGQTRDVIRFVLKKV